MYKRTTISRWKLFRKIRRKEKKKRKRKGTCVREITTVLPMLIWDSLKKKATFNWQNCIEEYSFSRPDLWFISRGPAIRELGQFQGWNSINHLHIHEIDSRSNLRYFSFLKEIFFFFILKISILISETIFVEMFVPYSRDIIRYLFSKNCPLFKYCLFLKSSSYYGNIILLCILVSIY